MFSKNNYKKLFVFFLLVVVMSGSSFAFDYHLTLNGHDCNHGSDCDSGCCIPGADVCGPVSQCSGNE